MAISELTHRDKVFLLEREMLRRPQVTLPLFHHFFPGVYVRELHIPENVTLTGAIHKYPCLSIMPKGDMSVLVDDKIIRVRAPFVNISPGGIKRIAYAHEDSVWITIHPNPDDETDIPTLENRYACYSEHQYLEFIGTKQIA